MRRGRKRKSGPRKRCGRLRPVRALTPAEIAAAMPHRRALGEQASNQLGENELGRMVLRGELDELLGRAGEAYLRLWRSYLLSVEAPRALAVTAGGFNPCADCSGYGNRQCLCERQRIEWNRVRVALADTGCTDVVDRLCFGDQPCPRDDRWRLKIGLLAVAQQFGLTRRGKRVVQNRTSK